MTRVVIMVANFKYFLFSCIYIISNYSKSPIILYDSWSREITIHVEIILSWSSDDEKLRPNIIRP